MAALAGGIVSLVLGIILIVVWWAYFIKALMAGVPILLILGGALAAYLGFEEVKDKRAAGPAENSSSNLKHEVETLKEELKELKADKKTPEKTEEGTDQ